VTDRHALLSGNGNGRSNEALSELRRLKSGAVAHEFTMEERRRGAQRTNEIKRKRAAKRRETDAEPLELAEEFYLLKADKMLLLQTFNRLSQELNCSDCRRGLAAVELVLKYLVRPRLRKEPGLGAAAITITERIRELGLDAKAEDIVAEILRPGCGVVA
jgi:hypothetical protein